MFLPWPTYEYTTVKAINLTNAGARMTGAALAADLNATGHRTLSGGLYNPAKRGIYSHIKSVYAALTARGHIAEAEAVATAFTKANGNYAYN